MGRTPQLFFEVAMGNGRSMRKAMAALEFLVGWGRASDAAGRPLETEEYGRAAGISRSQAFRRQVSFRQCFPADEVADTWEVVRPILDGETPWAKSKSVMQQGLIVGTFKWNP